MLGILATFASCTESTTTLHSFITDDDDGQIYWYVIYGQNDKVYYSESKVPLTTYSDILWTIADAIPESLTNAKELPTTELSGKDGQLEEQLDEAVEDAESDADSAESDAASDGDGGSDGGDGGGGE